MMAYKPLRVVSRHASNLGPCHPLQIANENAGNADSSRARSVHMHSRMVSFRCNEGSRVSADSTSQAFPGSSLAPLEPCLLSWMP